MIRVGNTVRRPVGAHSPFVQALLIDLARLGHSAAPRFLGIDEQWREVLSYIAGDVPLNLGELADATLEAAAR